MEIAVERKMEFAPRTAVPTPKLLKEIVLTGAGPFTVTSRNIPADEGDTN